MKITVDRKRFGERLAFDYDPEARTIGGRDADQVMAMIERWDGSGILYGTQPVEAPDPLGLVQDMAVMLASYLWDLPDDLAKLLPPAELIPDDAVA